MIDEALICELLKRTEDEDALVLLEGRAQVVSRADLASDAFRGADVLLQRSDLVDRLGTSSPTPQDVTRLAASLRDAADKRGA